MNRLFVILGAGASKDCSSPNIPRGGGPAPPLVEDLFSPKYMEILARYRAAQSAGAEIRKAGAEARAIEEFIRSRYRDADRLPDRRKYSAIPCYLQDLLHAVSTRYTTQADNYDLLVTALTRLPDVVFVTLNYDTLLDDRLHSTVDAIDSLDAYVHPERNWSLVKLHGSVNWGRRMDADINQLYDPDPDVPIDDEIVWRGGFGAGLAELRVGLESGEFYYPALAVPVGKADELVCPPAHVRFLKNKLDETDGAHLLVIGYSGYDREVLRLFLDSGVHVLSLHVVNENHSAANEVASRLGPSFGIGVPTDSSCDVPFREFVQSDRIERYIDKLSL